MRRRSTLRAAWKLDADEGIRKLEQYASWLKAHLDEERRMAPLPGCRRWGNVFLSPPTFNRRDILGPRVILDLFQLGAHELGEPGIATAKVVAGFFSFLGFPRSQGCVRNRPRHGRTRKWRFGAVAGPRASMTIGMKSPERGRPFPAEVC